MAELLATAERREDRGASSSVDERRRHVGASSHRFYRQAEPEER